MINKRLLRSEIVKNGLTQQKVAKSLGITPKTFSLRLKRGVFGTDDVEKMIEILHIKNPCEIFFASSVTYKDTDLETNTRDSA